MKPSCMLYEIKEGLKLHRTEDFRESAQAFIAELQMAFFSFGEPDHDIAVIKVLGDQPVSSSRLAHTALEMEGGQEQLRQLYERLKRYDAKVEFTASVRGCIP